MWKFVTYSLIRGLSVARFDTPYNKVLIDEHEET